MKNEKPIGILIAFETGNSDTREEVHFMAELKGNKLREDVKLRIRQVLNDIFRNASNTIKNYNDMVVAIRERGRYDAMLEIYEMIVRKFQHSDTWDYISDIRCDQQIGAELWILVDAQQRKIEIKDEKNDFRDLMEDILKSRKKIIKGEYDIALSFSKPNEKGEIKSSQLNLLDKGCVENDRTPGSWVRGAFGNLLISLFYSKTLDCICLVKREKFRLKSFKTQEDFKKFAKKVAYRTYTMKDKDHEKMIIKEVFEGIE